MRTEVAMHKNSSWTHGQVLVPQGHPWFGKQSVPKFKYQLTAVPQLIDDTFVDYFVDNFKGMWRFSCYEEYIDELYDLAVNAWEK